MTSDSKSIYQLYAEATTIPVEFKKGFGQPGDHDETDMSNPEERTEVQIAKDILNAIDDHLNQEESDPVPTFEVIEHLAKELLKMHGQSEDCEMGTMQSGSSVQPTP
jgi:hypothetical protein